MAIFSSAISFSVGQGVSTMQKRGLESSFLVRTNTAASVLMKIPCSHG